ETLRERLDVRVVRVVAAGDVLPVQGELLALELRAPAARGREQRDGVAERPRIPPLRERLRAVGIAATALLPAGGLRQRQPAQAQVGRDRLGDAGGPLVAHDSSGG